MKKTAGSFAVTFTFNQLSSDQTAQPKCHRGVLACTQLGSPHWALGREKQSHLEEKKKKKKLPMAHVAVKVDSDSSWAL